MSALLTGRVVPLSAIVISSAVGDGAAASALVGIPICGSVAGDIVAPAPHMAPEALRLGSGSLGTGEIAAVANFVDNLPSRYLDK